MRALGHAEDVADLGQRQALVVVEREHEPPPFRDVVDRVGEEHLHLIDLERLDRIAQALAGGVAHHGLARSLASRGEDLVEGEEADERDLQQRSRELPLAHAELPCQLGVVRRPPEARSPASTTPVRWRAPSSGPSATPSRTTAARR
jgi:hypothetical protein